MQDLNSIGYFDTVSSRYGRNWGKAASACNLFSMRDFLSMSGTVFVIVFTKLAYDWLERREKSTQRDKKP